METIRSFIALELTEEIHRSLAEIQAELKKAHADVKWVRPEGIHLTLKFLGNVSLELIEEVKQVLNRLAGRHHSFALQISQLGAFPKIEYPRVIWAGIKQGKEPAIKLAEDLEAGLIKLGFLPEKRAFKPHLTLGRVRSAKNRQQLKELLQSARFPDQVMQAENLTLFKSILTPQGAIYQALHQAKLS